MAEIQLIKFLCEIAETIDTMDNVLKNRHFQTAYISMNIAKKLDLPLEAVQQVLIAGLLRDIGTLSLKESLNIQEYNPINTEQHCTVGFLMLKDHAFFKPIADIIRFHHLAWNERARVEELKKVTVPELTFIVALADRIAVSLKQEKEVLREADYTVKRIVEQTGTRYKPDVVTAFQALAEKEGFWLDVHSSSIKNILLEYEESNLLFTTENFVELAGLFRRIVDWRSEFTIAHTAGVATCARKIGVLQGLGKEACERLFVGALLHDIGKLAVPSEIIDTPVDLKVEEFNVIRKHSYFTYRALKQISPAYPILFAGFHHERMDGSGYPFKLTAKDLPVEARILAISDVFGAVTEQRPYRDPLPTYKIKFILESEAKAGRLDPELINLVINNFAEIHEEIKANQEQAQEDYQEYIRGLLYS